ncbi:SusC/RagA family TonB-linked outer membrane protein [Pedobacter sp. MC2016-24]|uniref:SusC/RagA family TonB-linked outer membrane protein n=1 Tax=Pedobacter sp. MC2016-24 TaxID=2780090 RepID=UPI00187F241E|nr:SusC/RagA family TonB-linked outer membrane protein [Pedobacter sp. MC2016-24]MBE9600292.1 SusC/RagA family TonB-linked outer membrane protein [Pedobacter sp. MC2016-24]
MKLYPLNRGMLPWWLPPKLLLIMKMIMVLLTACFMQVSAATFAQNLTYSKKGASLEQIFTAIEKQTGYNVFYSAKQVDAAKKIDVDFQQMDLKSVMDLLAEDQDLDYAMDGKNISIKMKTPSFLDRAKSAILDVFQNFDVHGCVLDADQKPLPGATVKVKATGKVVSTDSKGNFYLKNIAEGTILVISYTGYLPKEVKAEKEMGNVILSESVGELDEVKLIGYGTTTQRLATGNTSRITAADIEKQPVANPLQTLQGRMPGVLVTNGQGLPGTETKIQIRGINSIAGNRNPLYIVDGVPFSATALYNIETGGVLTNFQNAASRGSFTPFNSLSPSDIESIDVLKDADATAIYGARGANGVILITTKKGKSGITKFDFDISHGISEASHLLKDFLPTAQYVALEKEGAKNDGYDVNDLQEYLPEIFKYDQNQNTDWQKVILGNTAHLTNVTGSISGGNSGTTFLLGGNYRKEGTIYPGDLGYTRGGAHFNLNHKSQNNKFFTSFSAIYTSDKNSLTVGGLPIFNLPNFPLFNADGSRNYGDNNNYQAILEQKSTTKTDNLVANGQFGYHITSDLNFKTALGFNRISLNGFNVEPLSSLVPEGNFVNQAQYANNTSTTINIEPQLNYIRSIGPGKLQVLFGGTYQSTVSQGNFIQGENYKDENLFENIGAAGNINIQFYPPTTTYTQYKLVSAFGRLNYNIKDSYILNANYRRDGSSRFGPGKQFGSFGTVGAAWIFSNEGFFKRNLSLISYGKVRASYGTIGNEPASDYNFLQSYTSSGTYQGNPGLKPARIGNPDYRWEVVKKLDIGLDVGVLSDRILISASWFRNRSDNQLIRYFLPDLTGFPGYTNNFPAVVDNKGLEFSINTENLKTKDFNWRSSFNLSFNNNTLVAYPGLEFSTYKYDYEIGKSLSIKKSGSFAFAGVDPQTGNSLYYNQNGEKTTNPQFGPDYFAIGKTLPDYYGGISNSFSYKEWQLDFLFSFVKQEGYRPGFSPGYLHSYMPEEALQRWQKPGDVTNVPKASLTSEDFFYYKSSSHFWADASYIKLKNLYLSYRFPDSWMNKAKINQLKLYVQGQNLLTFTRYKGSDPEFPSRVLMVPTLRTLTAGMQLTL